jgi:hypothetical protein
LCIRDLFQIQMGLVIVSRSAPGFSSWELLF